MVGSSSFNLKEHLSLLSLFFSLGNTFSNIIVALFFNLAHVAIFNGLVAIP
jgi:ssDNA-specific exonuclease RecJ